MNKLVVVREFEGNKVTFDLHSADGMINATQMAKPFEGKLTADYLRLDSTQELIKAVIEDENDRRILHFQNGNSRSENEFQYGNSHTELSTFPSLMTYEEVVTVVNGGRNNGTWMHRLLAIDFAAWLNPQFNVWMLRTMEEILFGRILEKRRRTERAARRRKEIRELESKIGQLDLVQRLEQLKREEKADWKMVADEYNQQVDLFTVQEDEEQELLND